MRVMSEVLSEEHNIKWDASRHRVRYEGSFLLFIIASHIYLLRCVGHIVNLAQQAFICALTGGTANIKEPEVADNEDDLDLSGLNESDIGDSIGPLLACVRALVIRVSYLYYVSYITLIRIV